MDHVYVVQVERFYMHGDELLDSDIVGAYESEEDALREMDSIIKRIIDHLKTLDPETYGYYRLDDENRGWKQLVYWDWERYGTNIDMNISVFGIPFKKSSE